MQGTDRNLVLLTVDALRADHVSGYGYERDTTPNLDDRMADGVQFRNAFSASSHTREAVPALLTGRYPDVFSDNGYRLVADSVPAYLDDDVHSAAFHSNPYVSRAYGFDRDFDMFDDDLHLGRHKLLALAQRALDKLRDRHYARAETINDRALSWLDSLPTNEPFFLWTHYMDTHGPYYPPREYRDGFGSHSISSREAMRLYHKTCRNPGEVTTAERQIQVDLYDAEVAYLDAQIESFLRALDDRGILEETLVVVTADHGDAFGEHGYYGHPRQLDDEVLHVPFVVLDPTTDDAGDVTAAVSTLDVVPTLLHGFDTSTIDLPGRALQAHYRSDANRPGAEREYVFAQARGEDDHENTRWYRAHGERTRATAIADLDSGDYRIEGASDDRIEHALADHVRDRLNRDHDVTAAQLDDDTDEDVERRLEALGYKE